MSAHPFVSVVIPVFNGSEALRECLRAVESQDYPKGRYEICVVDNASTEDIRSVVDSSCAAYLYEPKRGPAAARNRGIRESVGEIVAFTDADCKPCPRWLAEGVRALTADPKRGLVAGAVRLYPRDPRRPTGIELHNMATYLDQKRMVLQDGYAATASAFTRRAVLEMAGLFDERFDGAAFEDRELGDRIRRAGFEVVYAPEAMVEHPARSTWSEYYSKIQAIRKGELIYQSVRGTAPSSLASDAARFVKLPHRRLRALWSAAHPARRIRDKMRVIPVVLFAHYAGAWLRLRSHFQRGSAR